jgi:hypothetical protein
MSILLNNNPHAPAPWQIKRGGAHHAPTWTLVDAAGVPIAIITRPQTRDQAQQFQATLNLLENAPRLLAAVMEYALHEDIAHGGITEALATLIQQCGGKDLHSRVKTVDNPENLS